MIFDEDFDEEGPAPGAEIVPDGDNLCEIIAVKELSIESGDRFTALIVTMQPTDIRYAAFDKWLDPANDRDKRTAKDLREAVGLPVGSDLNERSLKGARVMVTTKGAVKNGEPVTDKHGRQRVWVNGIAACPHWKAARVEATTKPPARTQSQKAKNATVAAGGDADEVPF